MALTTDLSRSPYYDDYNVDKNFYRVLYRPGTAVQTRELNQMQTVLQDQIDKFGRHIFTEGSVVEGCSFTFDNSYNYVKINDTYSNGYAFTIADFQDKYAYNNNGLTAVIINTATGYISQNPDLNTLYIKYLNVGTFANGDQQSAFDNNDTLVISGNSNVANTTSIVGNVSVSSLANSTGQGYAFSTTAGVIFQKGFFVKVQPQTLIVSKYSNIPDDISVGFNSIENIITPEADTSLLDNAGGSPNYAAPGAHRLQLIPTLYTTVTSEIASSTAFFSLVDFASGVPTSVRNTPAYNILGKELAQRTYETNGNFIVSPFLLSTEPRPTTDAYYHDYNNLVSSRGLGYVEGYRVEFINNVKVKLRKGIDTEIIKNQNVSANYGNYVYINEYSGDFDTENLVSVELHNATKTSISARTFTGTARGSDTEVIGTATVKSLVYDSGTIGTNSALYRLYLSNISMAAGKNFSDVRSVINYTSSTVHAVADVVLSYNATLTTNIAAIQEPKLGTMIFPLGQQAIKSDGFNNTEFVYRNRYSAQILTSGVMTAGLPSIVGTGTESFLYTGSLNNQQIDSFVVIPTANATTANKPGNVTVIAGNSTVAGLTGATFDVTYRAGDLIKINSETHIVNNIVSATSLKVKNNFVASATNVVHAKAFVVGVPIDYTQPNRSITIAGSTATLNLGETLYPASTLQTTIYYDINRKNTVAIKKNLTRNAVVKINCATHSANSVGPWSLGIPDIQSINGIYIGTSGNYANSTTAADSSSLFNFNNGQTDTNYGLGSIKLRNNALNTLDNSSTIFIDFDVYTQDRSQGVGFFTANSYPVNDNPSSVQRATTVYTQEIPRYTSTSSVVYDLRDCVDYRTYLANNAVITTTASSANVNPVATKVVSILPSGSYTPSINSIWQSDVEHYLPRKDLAVIDTLGKIKIIEGISANIPVQPQKPAGVMALGVVNVPPYPSLTPKVAKVTGRYDYSISTSITQNRRYTMADIGTLSSRIDNLEYYTSLNLLEQSTNSLLVKNDTTGLNRFKNGILVDPFNGHDIGDTLDPNYNIAIDPATSELRPKFYQRQEVFDLDTTLSTGVVLKGPIVILDYNEVPYISQNYASKYRNCIEGNIYVWKTNIALTPNYQSSPDLTRSPDVIGSLDLSANWINLQKAWGTQWGNWTTVGTSTDTVSSKTLNSSTTDNVGNVTKSYTQRTTSTTSTTQTQTGKTLDITGFNDTQTNLGTFVTDVSILPYIQSSTIRFTSHGMKPGARVYAYFNNIDVTGWCKLVSALYGQSLVVSADGSIDGYFTIPPNTFQATELIFMLCDVSNLTTGAAAITTQGTGIYYASKLSIAKGQSILNTREPVMAYHEVTQQQTLVSTDNKDQTLIEFQPGPPIKPYVPPVDPVVVITPYVPPGGGGGDGYSSDGFSPGETDDCECDSEDDDDDGDE